MIFFNRSISIRIVTSTHVGHVWCGSLGGETGGTTGNRSSSIQTLVVRNVSIISIKLTRKRKNFFGICSISKINAIFCTFLIHKRKKLPTAEHVHWSSKYLCRTFRTSARKVAQCWNKRKKLRRAVAGHTNCDPCKTFLFFFHILFVRLNAM